MESLDIAKLVTTRLNRGYGKNNLADTETLRRYNDYPHRSYHRIRTKISSNQ
jgi:hypothetical protein